MDEIRRDPIKWFIEGFGVTSGAVFVLSGFFNSASFFVLWRLNYFLIASPSDVVMSAFIFGLMLVFGGLVALVCFGFFRLLHLTKLEMGWTERLLRSLTEALDKVQPRTGTRLFGFYLHLRNGFIAAALGLLILNIAVTYLSGGGFTPGRAVKPFWYETGLNVSPEAELPEACKGAHVAWLGSGAAILECKDGVRILHKLDDLSTVRRFE